MTNFGVRFVTGIYRILHIQTCCVYSKAMSGTRINYCVLFVKINVFSDIDECTVELDNCDMNAMCTNTIGDFTCQCLDGFMGDGVVCSGM